MQESGPLYAGGKHKITRPLHWWGYYALDKNHPWQEADALGVLRSGPSGGTTLGDQKKFMRYE